VARARNIKPGFCRNEDLAECDVWARLCFALLPMLADREGRLEDRPKKIKGELFPFDSIEVEPLLTQLEKWGMVARYTVDGVALIQILAFAKHQTPHHREVPSTLPPHPGLRLDADGKWVKPQALGACQPPQAQGQPKAEGTSQQPEGTAEAVPSTGRALPDMGSEGGSAVLIPDSLIPCTPIPPLKRACRFPEFWESWPRSTRKGGKAECEKVWAMKGLDSQADAILAHVRTMRGSVDWTKDGGQFIPAPVVYLRAARWDGAELGAMQQPKQFADIYGEGV
jgi:hypothetical protein